MGSMETTKSLGIAPPRPRPPLLARTLLQGPPTSISLDGWSFFEPAINSPLSLEGIFLRLACRWADSAPAEGASSSVSIARKSASPSHEEGGTRASFFQPRQRYTQPQDPVRLCSFLNKEGTSSSPSWEGWPLGLSSPLSR